ncbi:MAG TPA: MarR family transcriptional regulator [Bacillales bacterium]|nr:MarR family transcriptional regulator [Bacillales bacterium]
MMIQELIDRYIAVSFKVTKKAESLIKEQIGDDLTTDQHYILRYIYQSKECTSSELADVFEVNKSAITAIVNRMADREWIERTRDENDRRVVYLTLSKKGIDLFEKTEERIHCLVESIINQFNREEIQNFIQIYEKLAGILEMCKKDQMEE